MRDAHYDILIKGAGLAGCSLALALLHHGYRGRILLIEKAPTPNTKKTWCFWDKDSVPTYLQPLICKQWPSWRISSGEHCHTQTAQNGANRYCTILAGDFYHFVQQCFSASTQVDVRFGEECSIVDAPAGKVKVSCAQSTITANLGFNSAVETPLTSPNGLYQSFTGAWVTTTKAAFNPQQVGLMLDMQVSEDAMEFVYILPFSEHRALYELTRFSLTEQCLTAMQALTEQRLYAAYREADVTIDDWERGVLPMTTQPGQVPDLPGWTSIGLRGGMIRAATGYAFVPIQRWATALAKNLIVQGPVAAGRAIPVQYHWLDQIFLRVLRQRMALAPSLFMRMGQHTSAATFARFMTERADWRQIGSVVAAMPKKPFIRALLKS